MSEELEGLKAEDVEGIKAIVEKELAEAAGVVGHHPPPEEDKPRTEGSGTDWMGWTSYEDVIDFTCYGYPVPINFFVMRFYSQDTRRDRALWDCKCGRWIARGESEVRAWTRGWKDCRKNMPEVKAAGIFSAIMERVDEFGGKAIIQRLLASPITHGEPTGIGVFEISNGPLECLRFIVDEVLDNQEPSTINALDPRLGTVLQTAKVILHDTPIDEDALKERIDTIVRNFGWCHKIVLTKEEAARVFPPIVESTTGGKP